MSKRFLGVVTIFAAVFVFSTSSGAEKASLSISTGSMGGGFYPMGAAIAEYISKSVDNVYIAALTSGGVNENLNRLDTGKADLALLSSGDSYAAYNGLDPYKRKYAKMRGLGILYAALSQNYCLKESGIRTYFDLKGKTVAGGAPGGSIYKFLRDIAEVHGLSAEKDMKVVFLPHSEALDAVKLGRIHAAFLNPTIPAPVITELSLTHNVELIRFGAGLRDKLVKEKPMYLPMTVPGGTYKGIDQDVETIGMAVLWACREDLDEELVYNMVKAVYSSAGLAHLAKVHKAAKGIKPENAAKWIPFPLHSGAEKFFKEAGILK